MSAPYPYPGPYPTPTPMARWYHVRGPVGALTVLLVISSVANGLLILALLFMPFTWGQTDPMNSTTTQHQKVPSSPTSMV